MKPVIPQLPDPDILIPGRVGIGRPGTVQSVHERIRTVDKMDGYPIGGDTDDIRLSFLPKTGTDVFPCRLLLRREGMPFVIE